MTSSYQLVDSNSRELNEIARADASFESPDVLEAARKRRDQRQ